MVFAEIRKRDAQGRDATRVDIEWRVYSGDEDRDSDQP